MTYPFYPIHKYQFTLWNLLSVSYVSSSDLNDCVLVVGGFGGTDGMSNEVLSLGLVGLTFDLVSSSNSHKMFIKISKIHEDK